MTRGIKAEVDRMINDLQAQYFQYGPEKEWVQFAVRPIQLYEFVFPKEELPIIMKTLGLPGRNLKIKEDWKQAYFMMLRKALRAKKLPEMDLTKTPQRIISKFCVGVDAIGIRDEAIWPDGKYKGYEQL